MQGRLVTTVHLIRPGEGPVLSLRGRRSPRLSAAGEGFVVPGNGGVMESPNPPAASGATADRWLDVRVDEKPAKVLNLLLRLQRAQRAGRRGPEWRMDGKPVVVVFRRRDGQPIYRCEPRNRSEVSRIYFDLRKRLSSMQLRDFCDGVGVSVDDVVV